MRILIVDDEPLARARLRALLAEIGAGEVIGEAGDGEQALRLAAGADLVLLDIRMPGIDGIEVARHLSGLERPPAIVFTTAYQEHALAAFETCAVAYLLKPVRRERLAAALERASTPTRAQLAELAGRHGLARTHIAATVAGSLRLVPVDEVRCLRAEQKYVVCYWPGGQLVLDEPLAALEAELGERFVRVHRNALVAIEHVRALERVGGRHHALRLAGMEMPVEVSRRLIGRLRRRLRERLAARPRA